MKILEAIWKVIKGIGSWLNSVFQFIVSKSSEKVFGVPMPFLAFFFAILYILIFSVTIALMTKIAFFNVIFIVIVIATIIGFYTILSTVVKK